MQTVSSPPILTQDCAGWAHAAGYVCDNDVLSSSTVLRPEVGDPTRYLIRWNGSRIELAQEVEDERRVVLFAANQLVLERYLYGLFGDDIRDGVQLPYLELPWTANQVASDFEVSEFDGRYRILRHLGEGPVAAAPDETLSLVALVPLSHFLSHSVADLKRAFLAEDGAPLLAHGRYA